MSQYWTIVDNESGEILEAGFVTPSESHHPKDHGFAWISGGRQHAYRVDGPPDEQNQEWTGQAWARSAAKVRARRWAEAKVYRAMRLSEPLPIEGVVEGETIVADCDPDSRLIISDFGRAAMTAMVAQVPFEITFTAHDNRTFTVGGEQVIAISNAVLAHQGLCHTASQAIRDAIEVAETPEAIEAIDITAGYPQ